MTRNDSRHDPMEPPATDDRCACLGTEDGVVLYDPEDQGAWIQSDTALAPMEVR